MKKIFFIAFCTIILCFGTQEAKAQEQIDLTYYYTDVNNVTYYVWLRNVNEQSYVWLKNATAAYWTSVTNVVDTEDGISYKYMGDQFFLIPNDDFSILTMCNYDCSRQWEYLYYEN